MCSARVVGSAESWIELFHVQEMGAMLLRDRGEGFPFRFDFNRDLLERDRFPKIILTKSEVRPRF